MCHQESSGNASLWSLSFLTFIFPVVLSGMGRVFAISREAHGITSIIRADPTNAVSHPGAGEAAEHGCTLPHKSAVYRVQPGYSRDIEMTQRTHQWGQCYSD